MHKILLTYLVFLFFVLGAVAQKSTISGYIPGAENHEIRLVSYAELITYTENILDRTNIDSTGYFSFEIEIKGIHYCILDLDFYSSGIFIEPGNDYTIFGDTIQEISPYKAFYEKGDLSYQIDSLRNSDMNFLISEFNHAYNAFILENFDAIYRGRNKTPIKTFRQEVQQKYADIENNYFQDYIKYKIASIELVAASFKKPALFNEYFVDKPVQYFHVEYMQFFNQYFDQYLSSQSNSVTYNDLVSTINDQNSYGALLDSLGKDTLLINEVIREMVLMKSLVELYNNPKFLKQNMISILNQLATTTAFQEHKIIARSIINELSKLESGTLAPQFTLTSINDSLVSLSDFQGKPVYLSFLATWSSACLGEYKLLDSLYFKYGSDIEFITISLDKNKEIISQYIDDKGYEWLFLYNGTHYDIINSYNVKTFPLFVLISEDGRVLQYPAYKPSEVIEESLRRLSEKSTIDP